MRDGLRKQRHASTHLSSSFSSFVVSSSSPSSSSSSSSSSSFPPPPPPALFVCPLPSRVACWYDGCYRGHRTLLSATGGTNGERAASPLPGAFCCSLCTRDDRGQVQELDSWLTNDAVSLETILTSFKIDVTATFASQSCPRAQIFDSRRFEIGSFSSSNSTHR